MPVHAREASARVNRWYFWVLAPVFLGRGDRDSAERRAGLDGLSRARLSVRGDYFLR